MRAMISTIVVLTLLSAAPSAFGGNQAPQIAHTRHGILEILNQRVTLDGFEPNTPLKEALGFLSERYGVTILLDAQAFATSDPDKQPVKLPKMYGVSLRTALRMLLDQVQADYYVSRDGIIVSPREGLTKRLLAEKVSASFDRKPLNEALKELGDISGLSIVLDERRAGDKAKFPITIELSSVSVADAASVLADLAELRAVPMGRLLYVTTAENAAEIHKKQNSSPR
jgi:hypothetical protein